ncbi:MAG: hypothetical protein ACW98D_11580 [Promethearchaeota archaeon]|jgi:hypothetical protein
MIHTTQIHRKPISDLNKNFPSGFKTIYFRLLPDDIKFQIISNKLSAMEKDDFIDICTLLNFTLDDIEKEKHQLNEYLQTLKRKIKNTPQKPKKKPNKITQKELDNIRLRPNLFNQNIDQEYNRVFELCIKLIKKKYNLKELHKICKESNKIIFNLQIVKEADVKKLNDYRKELSLTNNDEIRLEIIQKNQVRISKFKTYILRYVNHVYTPIIEKREVMINYKYSQLEQFYFAVIDTINKRVENIKNKTSLDIKEFYFDDGLELHIMVKNKPSGNYPFKRLNFQDLETIQKRTIIKILKLTLSN